MPETYDMPSAELDLPDEAAESPTETPCDSAVPDSSSIDAEATETVRCPTCRASQGWSNECRRCGSDLSLLRKVAFRCRWHRQQSLWAINEERLGDALSHAQQGQDLRPDVSATQLLAVCLLLNGQFEEAYRAAIAVASARLG